MVDFRRICYLLKSPDFDRKVGGHAPDYPLDKLFAGKWKKGGIPPLWDGKAAERIVKKLTEIYK